MEKIERFRGCLMGLAVGDALGTTLEFSVPGTFRPLTKMVGGGPFGLEPGQWTDDTSMALCLAESLIARKGFDPKDQMEHYRRWWREGYLSSTGKCFDIGATVRAALVAFEKTGDPLSGPADPQSAGNGSLMRLAPVPMFFHGDGALAERMSGESSRTTHGALAAVDACRYFGSLLWGALNGAGKNDLLAEFYCPNPGCWEDRPLVMEIADVAAGSYKRKEPPDIKGTGYVVQSLEAALWAFHRSDSFEEGCLMAVNLGNDADTTGAIYGQLAGAFYGEQGIPLEWRTKVAMGEKIRQLAEGLMGSG
jgi:ADP-ribosylglycohydrolase